MPEQNPFDLESMLRVLGEEGVEYAIIGGNAAVIHGAMRATFDLDIRHGVRRFDARSLS